MPDVVAPELEGELERLETAIRQLKIQYDMFFAGAIPRPPHELRADVERLLKRYGNAPIRKYATRFHLNSLVSRFNSLSELWAKTLRDREEGDRPAPAVADRVVLEHVLARCVVTDPVREQESLKLLHARFVEARKKAGEKGGRVSFESFVRGIQSQAVRLRDQNACDHVELRLVMKDRKVQIKARPGR